MSTKNSEKPDSTAEISTMFGDYTAFEKWKYEQIFYPESQRKSWLNHAESFYRASQALVAGVAQGHLNEDVEGIVALFNFRHYLELELKKIVLAGRWLTREGDNAHSDDVEPIARIHDLASLWKLVLRDAKPKIADADWLAYDVDFVEQCIEEFNGIDPKGFAFRYEGQGSEDVRAHFGQLQSIMEHVRQVLNGIQIYLVETYNLNEEYLQEFNQDADWM